MPKILNNFLRLIIIVFLYTLSRATEASIVQTEKEGGSQEVDLMCYVRAYPNQMEAID